MSPGMYIAVDFAKREVIDEVILDYPYEPESKVQIEVLDDHARWVPLTDSSETLPLDVPTGLRRAATLELKARGIGYLLVDHTDFFAADMNKYSSFWGVTELHSTETARLYRIN
jgi:hypothetical protein